MQVLDVIGCESLLTEISSVTVLQARQLNPSASLTDLTLVLIITRRTFHLVNLDHFDSKKNHNTYTWHLNPRTKHASNRDLRNCPELSLYLHLQ